EAQLLEHFLRLGKYLQQQGILRIALAHAGNETARHPQRETFLRRGERAQIAQAQLQNAAEFLGLANQIAQLFLPALVLSGGYGQGGGSRYHVRLFHSATCGGVSTGSFKSGTLSRGTNGHIFYQRISRWS